MLLYDVSRDNAAKFTILEAITYVRVCVRTRRPNLLQRTRDKFENFTQLFYLVFLSFLYYFFSYGTQVTILKTIILNAIHAASD